MIDCSVIRDLLPLYADELVSPASRALVDDHIKTCPDCARLRQQMCVPLEPEPIPIEQTKAFQEVLAYSKQRTKRNILRSCLAILVVGILLWLVFLSTHSRGKAFEVTSTDPAVILQEMPILALTQEEKELGGTLLALPLVQEALRTLDDSKQYDYSNHPVEELEEFLASVLPGNRTYTQVTVDFRSICIDCFWAGEFRSIYTYYDIDNNGTVELIHKTIGQSDIFDEGTESNYFLSYNVALDETTYIRTTPRETWQFNSAWIY